MEGVYIYPPLGTLTCVREATVYFRVHFVYSDSSSSPSEAELWTNMYSSQGWQSIALHRSACTDGPATTRLPTELAFLDPNQLPSKQSRIQQFALDVAVTSDVSSYFEYTVRWKTSASAEWHWAGSVGQNARISVLLRNNTSYSVQTPLNHWRLKLKSVFEPIQAENRSDRRLTAVADSWNVSPTSASCAFKLGEPLSPSVEEGVGQVGRLADVHRYLAFVRKDQFWIIPHVGTQSIDTRGMDIVVLLAELRSGAYVAMMPTACTSTPAAYSAVLYIDAAQSISVRVSPPTGCQNIRVAACISSSPYQAVKKLFDRIRNLVLSPFTETPNTHTVLQNRAHLSLSLDAELGYCTWNTFYQQVSHKELVSTLTNICKEDAHGQTPPAWVLIDDGWQNVTSYDGTGQLKDMYADGTKFPGQLVQTVHKLSTLGIRRVGVWHTLWGYWGGIDPHGPLSKQYRLEKYQRQWSTVVKTDSQVWLISTADIGRFYDDFYRWLRDQGISFVKVDYQAAFESLSCYYKSGCQGVLLAEMYSAYQNAMETAALKYFGPGSIIHCMSQSPQFIMRTLQRQKHFQDKEHGVLTPRAIFRNSDDYFPDIQSSHGWHIYCNSANCIWSRYLTQTLAPDWDMFKPGQPESHMHSIARVMSGGPIYMTGSVADYAHQDTSKLVGTTGHVSSHLPPLLSSQCLFTDMTQTQGFLVESTLVTSAESIILSIYNVTNNPVISPVFLAQTYAEASSNQIHSSTTAYQQPFSDSEYYTIHQQSTSQVHVVSTLPKLGILALLPWSCDLLTVTGMSAHKSSDRSSILYAACLGDTSRYSGVSVVERCVYSVLPRPSSIGSIGSNCSGYTSPASLSTPPPPPTGLRQWNIRARVSDQPSLITFVFHARETIPNTAKSLPLNIDSVRVSGCDVSDSQCQFDSTTGVLTVAVEWPTTRIETKRDNSPYVNPAQTTSCITVCLYA